MVALRSEGQDDLEMHLVLHCDDHSVRETLSNSGNGIRRRLVQLLPAVEDQGLVYTMRRREVRARLGTRFSNRDDLARRRFLEGINRIILADPGQY